MIIKSAINIIKYLTKEKNQAIKEMNRTKKIIKKINLKNKRTIKHIKRIYKINYYIILKKKLIFLQKNLEM